MKTILGFAILCLIFTSKSIHAETALMSSAAHWFTCAAYSESGVKCWGNLGQAVLTSKTNIKSLVTGADHACAIVDESEVVCWTAGNSAIQNIPPFKNVKQLAAGTGFSCALDDNGVKCWGANDVGQLNVPKLKNPRYISSSFGQTCAIDDSGIKCWGMKCTFDSCVAMPKFKQPTMVSAGYYASCALDENKVKCWGTSEFNQLKIPQLKNPKTVAVSIGSVCAIDDTGLKCWGIFDKYPGLSPFPTISDAKSVTLGLNHGCVIKYDGSQQCWGDNSNNQLTTPEAVKAIADKKLAEELEVYRKSRPAQLIPAGSDVTFTKEILIEMNKSFVVIGNETNNLSKCLLLVEPDATKERRIRADKNYVIKDIVPLESEGMMETSFKLDGAPASISCFTDYPNILTVGEVTDALLGFGIKLKTLPIPEPVDFED